MPSLVSSTSASPPGAPWYENHDPRHKLGWRRQYGPPRLARRPPAPSRCKNQHRRPPLRRRYLSRTTSLRRTYSLRSKERTPRLDRPRKTHRRSPQPKIRRRPPPPKRLRRRLLTKAIPVPKPGEIPPHEKFYYLELLRRAGWLDQLPDEPHITLRVSDAARQRASQTLLEAGSRPHALRIAVGAGASYGSAKCWPPDRFAKALNALLSRTDADIILFGTPGQLPVSTAIAADLQR